MDRLALESLDHRPLAAPFHRLLGGHVEFGEYALDAVHREFQEEIGQSLTGVRLLGVLENIFRWNGATQCRPACMSQGADKPVTLR